MGGIAGHLAHLYDDRELTFSKIVKILSDASQGKLVATEKTDGANIFLSFRKGQALYARNQADIKRGGNQLQGLIDKVFKGGEEVKKAYVEAFQAFENAAKQFSPQDQAAVFGEQGNIFYNAEIQGPAFTNVVAYDKNVITIHGAGHIQLDLETGQVEPFNDEGAAKALDNAINQQEQDSGGSNFTLQRTAVIKLKALSSDVDLKIAKARIEKAISGYGMSWNNTIEDYLKAGLFPEITSALPELSTDIHENIVNNLLGLENMALPQGTDRSVRQRVSEIRKKGKQWLENIIWPIEDAIHDFSVEMLKGLKSAYILDNQTEVNRLRDEVAKAIKTIQAADNDAAHDVLAKQLKKIKHHENINTPVEGIVFQYDGKTYKFTGNFAPVNQILGLFRYGRGNTIPAFQQVDEAETGNKVVAIIPGGFKPPHAGHYGVADYVSNMPEVDKVFVFISPKERGGHSGENRIEVTAKQSLAIWKIYTQQQEEITPAIPKTPSPVKATYEFMESAYMSPGDTLLLVQGEKEIEAGDTRFNKAQAWSDQNNLGITVKIISTPMFSAGISGTQMRELIAAGKQHKFMKYLPAHLSREEKEKVWNILVGKGNKTDALEEDVFEMISEGQKENVLFKHIQQIIDYVTNGGFNSKTYDEDVLIKNFPKTPEKWISEFQAEMRQAVDMLDDFSDLTKAISFFLDEADLVPAEIFNKKFRMNFAKSFFQGYSDYFEFLKITRFFYWSGLLRNASIKNLWVTDPGVENIIKQFKSTGLNWKQIDDYFEVLSDWHSGHTKGKKEALIAGRAIYAKLSGRTKFPPYLYRGMIVSKTPKPGQNIYYTSKYKPLSGWSENQSQARGFCGSGDQDGAVLLRIENKDFVNRIIWAPPLPKSPLDALDSWNEFRKEAEFIIDVRKPIPVPGWNECEKPLKESGEQKDEGEFQAKLSSKHPAQKKRLIATGPQDAAAGDGPFVDKPDMKRSKSAPPIGEAQRTSDWNEFFHSVMPFLDEIEFKRVVGTDAFDMENSKIKEIINGFKSTGLSWKNIMIYFSSVSDWLTGNTGISTSNNLIHGKAIFDVFGNRADNLPVYLYRGMWKLKKVPRKPQKVAYTSKVKPLAGWTDDSTIANNFCGGDGKSIILKILEKDFANRIVWAPPGEDSIFQALHEWKAFQEEREYIIDVREPLPVPYYGECGTLEENNEIQEKEQSNSAMIAIMLPDEVANKLDTKEKDLHITLVYLPEVKDAEKIKEFLRDFVENAQPMEAKLGGVGQFKEGPDGIPYFAIPDVPTMNVFQSNLAESLNGIANVGTDHGFNPHITLGYAKTIEEVPEKLAVPDLSWTVDSISFVQGEEREDFQFGVIKEMSAASGGAIEGAPGQKKQNTLIRELESELLELFIPKGANK